MSTRFDAIVGKSENVKWDEHFDTVKGKICGGLASVKSSARMARDKITHDDVFCVFF